MTYLLADEALNGVIIPRAGGYKNVITLTTNPTSVIEAILSNVVAVLTIVGGIMFMLYFLMGALQWVSAAGDKGKIDKAKGMLTNSAIGLIVILLSYSIIWIVGKVLGVDILNPADTINKVIKFQ